MKGRIEIFFICFKGQRSTVECLVNRKNLFRHHEKGKGFNTRVILQASMDIQIYCTELWYCRVSAAGIISGLVEFLSQNFIVYRIGY
jgi:hypothetical protein